MSSSAQKLEATDCRARNDGAMMVRTIEDLFLVLSSDARFSDFEAETPEDSVIRLSHKDRHLVIIGDEVWTDQANLAPFLVHTEDTKDIILICCGPEDKLEEAEHLHETADVHFLVFPSSLTTISFQLNSIYRQSTYHAAVSAREKQADEKHDNVKHVLSISRALNGIRDVNKLLDLILEKARQVTQADAGSIYVATPPTEKEPGEITFKICHNESIKQDLSEFKMPMNEHSIVGNAALNQRVINIPDLYELKDDSTTNPDGFKHDISWDKRTGYECHSMLTLPIFDISHTVIGVIQLINRKKSEGPLVTKEDMSERIIPFNDDAIEYAEIVSHQAGIALENALLTEEKQALFEGFVDASVKAIESRDPTTSGHSHRVATLTLEIAKLVDHVGDGPYRQINFNEAQMREIKFASLLHDFGKLGVREQVLLKAKKLYPWEMQTLLQRFELIESRYEVDYYKELVNFFRNPNMFPPGSNEDAFDKEFDSKLEKLNEFLDFILKANEPTVLEQGGFEKLKDIANLQYEIKGEKRSFLLDDELKALSISRGSLTREEFAEIQSHVTHTYEFLRKIPWGKDLVNVPQIAAKHHEKLDGSGYPTAATGEEIPIQSRMMTIADIFDALTASDRPYKKAVPVDRAISIIEMEVKAGKCDRELFDIFVKSGCYKIVL